MSDKTRLEYFLEFEKHKEVLTYLIYLLDHTRRLQNKYKDKVGPSKMLFKIEGRKDPFIYDDLEWGELNGNTMQVTDVTNLEINDGEASILYSYWYDSYDDTRNSGALKLLFPAEWINFTSVDELEKSYKPLLDAWAKEKEEEDRIAKEKAAIEAEKLFKEKLIWDAELKAQKEKYAAEKEYQLYLRLKEKYKNGRP